MENQLRSADLIVLILYMAGVFGLGCWFARKSSTTQEFMAAGRSIPGWAVGLSIFGTYVSSIGFLGNTGKAFGSNWNSWVFGFTLPMAALIAVKYFVPLYRSSDSVSAYAHLEQRFGPWARSYALVCYLLTQLARTGTILYLVALALAPLTGWDVKTIILITGLLVTVYTLLGGIEAVIWTDVAQSIVLIAGAILCAIVVVTNMPEGPGQLFKIANENDKFSLGSFSLQPATLTMAEPTFWMVLVYGLFINLQNFGIDQSFVQRYITAKSDRDATFSVWLGAILFPVISVVFFFIGTGLFSLYNADPALLNEVKAQVAETQLVQAGEAVTEAAIAEKAAKLEPSDIGDKVLPHFIVRKLPAGIAGLLIAAIFAAAMSSMDTSLNSSATLVLCDVYKRYYRPDVGERESMKVLYISTFVFGIVGTFTALAMMRVKSALDVWWNLQGIFTGGMLGLFLLGLISKRARNQQEIVAGTVGILLILWLSLSTTNLWPKSLSGWSNPLHSFMTIVLGTSSIVLVGVLAAQFASGHKASEESRHHAPP
ncbi:MAG: sodium:solute symporter [Planctomycetota bacterium]|nr:sodium:solute symporter [Planctomycetota bacterium]